MFSLAFLLCIYITKLPNNYNAVLVRKESHTLVYWTSNYGIIYFALTYWPPWPMTLVLQICVKVQLIMLITSAKLHHQAQFFLVLIVFVSFLCILFRSWGFWKVDQQICFNSSFYKNQDLYFPSCESMCLDKNDKRCIIINTILGQIQGFVFRSWF